MSQPKLGLDIKASLNSAEINATIQQAPGYSPEGFYFFISIKSTQPAELRAALEEFVTTGVAIAKEMSPEVEGLLGETPIQVFSTSDSAVIAINLNDNPATVQLADLVKLSTEATVKNEAQFSLGFVADTTFSQLLSSTPQQLEGLTANFHLALTSTLGDKYNIKNSLIRLIGRKTPTKSEDKFLRLVFLMFHSFTFKIHSEELTGLGELALAPVTQGQKFVESLIGEGRSLYQGNKELLESFPFVQAFFDAVDQYGDGRVDFGLTQRIASLQASFYGAELGQIYKRIIA